MQINDLVQNKNNIKIFEDFTNYDLEMAKIPNGFTTDGDLSDSSEPAGIVYKWMKKEQNWQWNIKVNSPKSPKGYKWKNYTWTSLKQGPSEDDQGNPYLDKDGKQQQTKYTRRWRHYVEQAGREIDLKQDKAAPATTTKPIPNEKAFTYGQVTYIFDDLKKAWFNKGTKVYVNKNSLLNATLMANFGFKPDGESELDPTYKEKFLSWVGKQLPDWLSKGGRLGQDSQVSARNVGGRRGGEIGDLLGRLSIANGNFPSWLTNKILGPSSELSKGPEDKKQDTKGGDQRPPQPPQDTPPETLPDTTIPNDSDGRVYKALLRANSTDTSKKRDSSVLDTKVGELRAVNTKKLKVNDVIYYIGQEDSGKPGQWIKGKIKNNSTTAGTPADQIIVVTDKFPAGVPIPAWKLYMPVDTAPSVQTSTPDRVELRQMVNYAIRKAMFTDGPEAQQIYVNPYKILGLDDNATNKELSTRYKTLGSMYHPDREGGDAGTMAKINSAYGQIKKG